MEIKALGYLAVAASDVDGWVAFATQLLGLQVRERTAKHAAFRIDDRLQRLVVTGESPPGEHRFGWEVENKAALDRLGARLEAHGVEVKWAPGALADRRGVSELMVFRDPAGNYLEVFHGAHAAREPFVPGRPVSGFRTGTLGLGHVVLTVQDASAMLAFYGDLLGFRLSDYMRTPFGAHFLHVNARHHSLALIETGSNGVHHVMIELLSLDDVGQAYDLAQCEDGRVGVTLGRHSNDFMTSFYARTPSQFMIEYGWGGREIDVDRWHAQELLHGASLWGHERYWLPPERRLEARALRLKAAVDGHRAPVHVLEGYYRVMNSR